MCLEYEFVQQDFEYNPNAITPVELDIPSGMKVTGAGAHVTEIKLGPTWYPVDDPAVSGFAFSGPRLQTQAGPHPSDPAKWRVVVAATTSWGIRISAWITAIG